MTPDDHTHVSPTDVGHLAKPLCDAAMAVLDGDHSEARGIFDRLTPGERVAFEHVLDDLSNLMADAIEAGNG